MSIDMIGDFLTIIRNGVAISKRSVAAPYSKMREELARVLKEEGYIDGFDKKADDEGRATIELKLRYVDGESAIHEVKRVSRPGRRAYAGCKKFKPTIGGLGISIVTTNAGVMTDRKARSLSVGGEVICSVW